MTKFRKFKRKNNKIKRKIIHEYKTFFRQNEYNEALRLVFSFIYGDIFQIAKQKKIYLELELSNENVTGCYSFSNDSKIIFSRKDISELYTLVECDKTIVTCYNSLVGDIKLLPKELQIDYKMDLYRPTIFITAIYLIFGHEATHGFAKGSNHVFANSYVEEKQCDTSASLMVINLYHSLLTTFNRNNLLVTFPKEIFESALIMNIMLGVLFFTKYITRDGIHETQDYLLHEERRILCLIGAILALPAPSQGKIHRLCDVGVNMYSKLFETTIEEAQRIFNSVAEKFDKLND